jgi:hypothetical protein
MVERFIAKQLKSQRAVFLQSASYIWQFPHLLHSSPSRMQRKTLSPTLALELPSTIRTWLDMWLWLLDKENPALVALFESPTPPNIASIRAYLSSIVRRAGIEFFTYEITPPAYPQSVGSRYCAPAAPRRNKRSRAAEALNAGTS